MAGSGYHKRMGYKDDNSEHRKICNNLFTLLGFEVGNGKPDSTERWNNLIATLALCGFQKIAHKNLEYHVEDDIKDAANEVLKFREDARIVPTRLRHGLLKLQQCLGLLETELANLNNRKVSLDGLQDADRMKSAVIQRRREHLQLYCNEVIAQGIIPLRQYIEKNQGLGGLGM